jgi:hypothetical protein
MKPAPGRAFVKGPNLGADPRAVITIGNDEPALPVPKAPR